MVQQIKLIEASTPEKLVAEFNRIAKKYYVICWYPFHVPGRQKTDWVAILELGALLNE